MDECTYYRHVDYINTHDYTADENGILSLCYYIITHDYNTDRY